MKMLHRSDKPLDLLATALLKLFAMIETELKEALQALKIGIDTGNAETIKTKMSFLDESLTKHRKVLNSQLKHYLRNRSYMKALAYLDGESKIPKGRCGGRTDFS